MTNEQWEQRLAEALGGELDDDGRKEFDAMCASDPDRADEYARLSAAVSAMQDLPAGAATRQGKRFAGLAAAAAIGLAFLAGYATRGAFDSASVPGRTGQAVAVAEGTMESAVIDSYRRRPTAGGLTQCLLALGHADTAGKR